jgi:hypothetical protein
LRRDCTCDFGFPQFIHGLGGFIAAPECAPADHCLGPTILSSVAGAPRSDGGGTAVRQLSHVMRFVAAIMAWAQMGLLATRFHDYIGSKTTLNPLRFVAMRNRFLADKSERRAIGGMVKTGNGGR